MIAIDTNVLLGYLLKDHAKQAAKANSLVLGSDEVLITDVVLTETIWTLKGKRYSQLNKTKISAIYTFDKAALEIDGSKGP